MNGKRIIVVLVSMLGLVLSGCTQPPPPPSTGGTMSHPGGDPDVPRPVLSEEFVGRIDGSTATVPLMRSTLQLLRGTDDGMHFNKTIEAYNKLIAGEKDIIFVTPPSKEELEAAEKAGVELEVIPIVKDALVFLANKANPVDGLTGQEVKDIYTGKTTSWKQVGGPDKKIVPYQRQVNSGSQTLFLQLAMGGDKPMKAPRDYYIDEMEGLVDHVAIYDNSERALGYSVFYFTQEMYVKDSVKLLAIDGVVPSTKTIADGSYAYLSNYFAVMRKSEPVASVARQLVDWCLSDEAQRTFSAASYVPLEPKNIVEPDSGYGYQGSTPQNTSQSSGTGGPAGLKASHTINIECEPECVLIDKAGNLTIGRLPQYPQAEAAISDWLSGITQGTMRLQGAYANSWNIRDLMLVLVGGEDFDFETLIRLSDGHQMELSDFFYDGVNYIEFINRTLLNEAANQQLAHFYGDRIGPFTGLPAHTRDFSMNYWSGYGMTLLFDFPPGNPFVAWEEYPNSAVSVELNLPYDLSPYGYLWQTKQALVNGHQVQHVVSNYNSVNPQDAKINAAIDAWVSKRKGDGRAGVEIRYYYEYHNDSGDDSDEDSDEDTDEVSESYTATVVFDVTWSAKNNYDSAVFNWKTCKKIY